MGHHFFENKTVGHSSMVKKLRIELVSRQNQTINIPSFIEGCFSLEMKNKARWIE